MTDRLPLPSVDAARAIMLAAVVPRHPVTAPLDAQLLGQVLARDLVAMRDQPPFFSAAMDGYAVGADGLGETAKILTVIGESAAGQGFSHGLGPGEAVRIFTGAPVPEGAAFVVPQENATRRGDQVDIHPRDQSGPYIRAQGSDFRAGDTLLARGVRLDPWRLGLAAASGWGGLEVYPPPRIAILSTGAELVPPGASLRPDQIFDSGSVALSAWARQKGAETQVLTPATDDARAIRDAVAPVVADLIVTIGGASVGDHDLVKPAMKDLGLDLRVDKVAVRPGKPVWFGRLADGRSILGLPGNPASALVCAELFLHPLIAALSGATPEVRILPARTTQPLSANGAREHWMRATLRADDQGKPWATPMSDQDSSLLNVFAQSNGLIRRLPGAAACATGDPVEILPLDRM